MKFTTILFLFFSLFCNSQEPDFLGMNIFTNPAEHEMFKSLQSGKGTDYLLLYLTSDGSNSSNNKDMLEKAREKIGEFTSSADISKLKQGTSAKALKKLYKSIHDAFLSKYVTNPFFGELFETGTYNCATASALYVIILEELGVRYSIHETPTHVYLVVSPGDNDVVFETTTPGAPTLVLNEKTKAQYLEYLYSNKIISREEWTTINHEELFRRNFYADEIVSPKELGGIIYYNRGIATMIEEKYKQAYFNFEKAFYLYPHQKMRYLVSASIANYLMSASGEDEENKAEYFIRFFQVGNKEMAGKMVVDYVDDAANKYLFKNPDPAKYRRISQRMISMSTDTALTREIREVHYYHTAHYFDIKDKHDSTALYLDSVYALNKSNLLIQELITSASGHYFLSLSETSHAIDTVLMYFEKYPFLELNGALKEFSVYCLTKEIARYYEKDKAREAGVYGDLMKVLLEKEAALVKKTQDYITGAVLEMYYYYVRTKKYKEGKAFLQYVHKYMSGNEEIARRLKRIDEIMANQ